MDNNNNNDFMSIFNNTHIDPNGTDQQPEPQQETQFEQPEPQIQNNPWVDVPKATIVNENVEPKKIDIPNVDILQQDIPEQKIDNIVKISQEQINEQILGQSDIIQSTGDIRHSQTDENIQTEVKTEEPLNVLVVLIFGLIIGIVVFAGFNFAEKYFSKPKDSGKTNEKVEKIYNFEQSFSEYIKKLNETSPITNTIACVSEKDKDNWNNHSDFKNAIDCNQLISAYKQTDSAVEIPSYGVIYINEKGVKNGTHFIYDDGYVCSYDKNEKRLFKCEMNN